VNPAGYWSVRTCAEADLQDMATALAAMTGQPHPLAITERPERLFLRACM